MSASRPSTDYSIENGNDDHRAKFDEEFEREDHDAAPDDGDWTYDSIRLCCA